MAATMSRQWVPHEGALYLPMALMVVLALTPFLDLTLYKTRALGAHFVIGPVLCHRADSDTPC